MDGADARGMLVIGLAIGAGLASFALAGLVGGAIASVVVPGPAGRLAWLLVAVTGIMSGQVALVGLILTWDALRPVFGDVPLLYPAWGLAALGGIVSRAAVSSHLAPSG